MYRNAEPWKNSPETPNIGTWAQTDDIRPGMQLEGLMHLRDFVNRGGVFVAATIERGLRAHERPRARRHARQRTGTDSRVVGIAAADEDRG